MRGFVAELGTAGGRAAGAAAGRAHPRPRLRRRRADRAAGRARLHGRRGRCRPRHGARGPRARASMPGSRDGRRLPFEQRVRRRVLERRPALDEGRPRRGDRRRGAGAAAGGRFVGEMGGHGNVAAITVALLAALARRGVDGVAAHPMVLPHARRTTAPGWSGKGSPSGRIELLPRPTPPCLPAWRAWLETFAGPVLAGICPRRHDRRCAPRPSSCCGLCCGTMKGGGRPTMCGCASRQCCNVKAKNCFRNSLVFCLV